MATLIALILISANLVTVQGNDYIMVVEPDCAALIEASGYTDALDIHRYLTPTPEYVEACF